MKNIDFSALKKHTPEIIGFQTTKRSAVCITLLPKGEDYDVLFEVRSSKVDSQPGDICFPGGMMEEGERPEETAVRECMEELLMDRDRIEVIAPMDYLYNGHIIIYPYLIILHDYENTFSTDEVAEVFRVPLSSLLKQTPDTYFVHAEPQPGEDFPFEKIVDGRNYKWRTRTEEMVFYDVEGEAINEEMPQGASPVKKNYSIWGMTGKILKSVINQLNA